MKNLFVAITFISVILGCGKQAPAPSNNLQSPPHISPSPVPPVSPQEPKPVPPPLLLENKVIVAMFGAPWCGVCKSEFPNLQRVMQSLTPEQRARLDVRLYVPTGMDSQQPPTPEVAEWYRRSLGLSYATAYVDPWRWQLFRKWVSSKLAIPGGAVLSADEVVLKKYPPGSFSVEKAVHEALKH